MSRNHTANTRHGTQRAVERTTNLSKRELSDMIRAASKRGLTAEMLPPGPLRTYVAQRGTKKRVKYYRDYLFIFQRTSTSLITMYPIPETVKLAQADYDQKHANELT